MPHGACLAEEILESPPNPQINLPGSQFSPFSLGSTAHLTHQWPDWPLLVLQARTTVHAGCSPLKKVNGQDRVLLKIRCAGYR